MNPNWLFLIVPLSIMVGVYGAYYANTYKGMDEPSPREKAMAEAAEAFLDQYIFNGRQGMMDGECDYAIRMMMEAARPNPPRTV